MTLADAILPGLALAVAWLGRRVSPEPPAARYPGPADIPWPAAPPPTTPATSEPPLRPTDVGPIDPSTDLPREPPAMQRGMPTVSRKIDDAIAKQRSRGAPRWRPAIRPTPSEVSRARALLAPGYWHEGTIEEAGNTQYRGAWHPSRGGGRHKGVEVWHRR